MKQILICTLGSAPQPIVHAIQMIEPDYIYFICSGGPKGSNVCVNGPGKPCGIQRKQQCPKCKEFFLSGDAPEVSIAKQLDLRNDQYEIVTIDNFDDLNSCIGVLSELAESLQEKFPDAQINANYTGGTKTMSTALAIVAILTETWKLWLNKGERTDRVKITEGDTPVIVSKWRIVTRLRMKEIRNALLNFEYSYAELIITEMLLHLTETEEQKRLIRYRRICQAFYQWDIFNHEKALKLLKPFGRQYSVYLIQLKKIMGIGKSTGYEMVADLMHNAFRCAHRKHYDDAVARLYRMTEYFAQIRLSHVLKNEPGDVPVESLPDDLRSEYESRCDDNGNLLLGLRDDFELLNKLDDSVGNVFKESEDHIVNALQARNYSILAHGLKPLTEKEYRNVKNTLVGFLQNSASAIKQRIEFQQFPRLEIIDEKQII